MNSGAASADPGDVRLPRSGHPPDEHVAGRSTVDYDIRTWYPKLR